MLTEPTFEQPCACTISAVTNEGIEFGRRNKSWQDVDQAMRIHDAASNAWTEGLAVRQRNGMLSLTSAETPYRLLGTEEKGAGIVHL